MRYIYVYLTDTDPTSSTSTFDIYYGDYITGDTIADIYYPETNTYTTATGVTYLQLVTKQGVLIAVPDNTQYIKLHETTNVCPDITQLAPIFASVTVTDAYCANSGSLNITSISGGDGGPYQIKLNSNGTYEVFSGSKLYDNLPSGTYDIYIKDASSFETIITREILPYELAGYIGIYTNPTPPSNPDGIITLTSYGGVGNRTYNLYQNTAYPTPSNCGDTLIATYTGVTEIEPTITVTGVSCGSYCLEVIDDNSCTYYDNNVSICSVPLDIIQFLTVSLSDYTPTGFGSFNGTTVVQSNLVTSTVSGCTSPYTYQWEEVNNLDGLTINTPTSSSTRFSAAVECHGVYTGTFRLKVTDFSGICTVYSDVVSVTLENNYPGICTNN